ncbi:NAD kinase 2, mitochondrial [Brevipalpus obovatus]|uniref:NAD kinase 2, mitochondrial n=1 Tax=Brevipalpus obovatus TaxID=246614 RepID=UPI003D9EFA79
MLRSLFRRTATIDYLSNHFGRYFATKQSQTTMINNNEPGSGFKPQKALVLSKFSRYELEKRRYPSLSEEQLSIKLEKRGSDYQGLVHHHKIHSASKNKLKSVLENRGIEVKFINRLEYNRAVIDWADVIFTTGGDGTFLAAASLIKSPNKTVIGINSDPSRSVGYLCLPQPYSSDLDATLDKLFSGQFKWLFRQRIRITLQGENALDEPLELHKQQLICPDDYLESGEVGEIKEFPTSPEAKNIPEGSWRSCQLPVRALNEVFVGENHSARVSYCELTVDDRPRVKFRSSGVAVCAGTGSTSWSFNISRIPKQTVQSILEIAKAKSGDTSELQDSFVDDVTKEFNDSLVFEPEKLAMAYTIRDPQILDDNFLPSRAFAQKIEIKSRMDDACVVIDGGLSYRFNDGNIACFEMKEEDALRTVTII